MKTESRHVKIRELLLYISALASLTGLFNGCGNVTHVTVDEKHHANSQNSSPGIETIGVEPIEVMANKSDERRIDISAALNRVSDLKRVELFDSSGKRVVGFATESGRKILQLLSKSTVVSSEDVEEEGFPEMPSFRMQFFFGDSRRLDLSFFDDGTAWNFADNGGEQRDFGDEIETLNSLLKDTSIQIRAPASEWVQVADVSQVELYHEQKEGQSWHEVDLQTGKEILKKILDSVNMEVYDDASKAKFEVRLRKYHLRFMVRESSFLHAEIFEHFTWIRYEDVFIKQDTRIQYKSITELISKETQPGTSND